MKVKPVALIAGLLIILGSGDVYAEPETLPPHIVVTSPDVTLKTPNQTYSVPVGTHMLDGTSFQKLDDKLKEDENLATRYKAENESLKKSLDTWQPGWGTLIFLTGLAIAGGTIAYYVN